MPARNPAKNPRGQHIPNRFYTQIQGGPASDALLCVLLELRIGGILEGMQLEQVEYSHALPYVGGMVITFRRSDSMHFSIDTTSALTIWPDETEDERYTLATDIDEICASLQATLARLVTSTPLKHATPLDPAKMVAE